MTDRLGNLVALLQEHAPAPLGPVVARLVCDGCGSSTTLVGGAIPPGWRVGAANPPDLCPRCAAGAGSLRTRLLGALRCAVVRRLGPARELVFVPGRRVA